MTKNTQFLRDFLPGNILWILNRKKKFSVDYITMCFTVAVLISWQRQLILDHKHKEAVISK